jgi:DNA modification methylase
MSEVKIIHGFCEEVLKGFADNYFDAIITDPPYGLSFMGKKWDYEVPTVDQWKEILRVLKPGGYLLSFAGTRTQHRMACNIEDAGFEIRDMIFWCYGQGFPKSLNIGKAVDKLQGNERETVREYETHDIRNAGLMDRKPSMTVTETKGTSEFEGWGTALKPAIEPIGVYYKPLTISNVVSILCLEITNLLEELICQRSLVNVPDAEKIFQSIYQSLNTVGELSVAESAKTLDWENIESVIFAAINSTSQKQRLIEKDIIRDNFVQENARENGRNKTLAKETQIGEAANSNGVDTFILELREHISENTVLLWKNILEEALIQMNTYTTLTAINKITELKILRSFLYQNISRDIGNSSLNPALEPITVARKPIEKGLSVAENCLKWGTGGINIDGCRIEYIGDTDPRTFGGKWKTDKAAKNIYEGGYEGKDQTVSEQGRFPANFIHDGSQEVLDLFPQSAGQMGDLRAGIKKNKYNCYGDFGQTTEMLKRNDSGSAARFFYCAKASKQDRDEGLEGFEPQPIPYSDYRENVKSTKSFVSEYPDGSQRPINQGKNNHPTVKPTSLMRYLCRLVTPPNGIILDPFCGSGSTGKAAVLEGFRFVGIDKEIESVKLAEARTNIDPLFRQVI